MDKKTLEKFEGLGLKFSQKPFVKETTCKSKKIISEVSGMDQRSTVTPGAKPDKSSPTGQDSRPPNSVQPSQSMRMTRSQSKKAVAPKFMALKPRGYQTDHTVGSPSASSSYRPRQPIQESTTSGADRVNARPKQYNPNVAPFVPWRALSKPSIPGTKQIPHKQQVSLSTKASARDFALPIRSRKLPPPSTKKFSSSSTSTRRWKEVDWRKPTEHQVVHKFKNSDELIHLPAPDPTKAYMAKANTLASRLPSPQRLLLVLDLNGTLLFRTSRSTNFVPRPGLEAFLTYCFANHSVLIWSSARPRNVEGLCKKVFAPTQLDLLLGQWGRDTFHLTPKQYKQRVQVYKNLDKVWNNAKLQFRHPNFDAGERWGQHNTVLIDDSPLKAAGQPFNLLEVPEFVKTGDAVESATEVLEQVMTKLEELRGWSDVSACTRAQRASEASRAAHKGVH